MISFEYFFYFISLVLAGFTKEVKTSKYESKQPSLDAYKNYFEEQYLTETERYYLYESNTYLENNSMRQYLNKVMLLILFSIN